jgi:hypothetical protein
MIDLSRFKVVHGDRVLNALALDNIMYKEGKYPGFDEETYTKPQFLTVLAINEDGNIVAICDEAWRFQFLPIKGKED